MVNRIINGLELEIDEKEANELYFPEDFVDSLEDFDGDIEVLKENVYKWNGNAQYMPLSVLWELTNYCNFKCPFCYINTDLAKRYPYLTLDEAKKIIDELVEMGMLFCCLTGGECLLHPQFADIYKYLKQKGVLVTIFTNGSILNTEIMKLFREYKPYKIEISIYGLSEPVFKATTDSSASYSAEMVLDVIEQLSAMGINVRCKSPITILNESEIMEIQEWCSQRGIDYYTSEEMLETNEGLSREEFAVKSDVVEKVKINREAAMRNRRDYKFDCKRAWECSAGKYAGVIGADLNFYPCLAAVGLERFTYSMAEGITKAVEKHKSQVYSEKGKKLHFCKGCEWCNVCEKCIISGEKESEDRIWENCMRMKNI